MAVTTTSAHTLVVYGPSDRADAALRRLAPAAVKRGDRVTVLSLAAQEAQSPRCCDSADPRVCGIGRLQRRRLRRRSPVPVSDGLLWR